MPRKTTEPPRKRAKVERPAGQHTEVPSNIQDISQVLRTQNPDILAKALPTLRSKLYPRPDEVISPQDERLQLLKSWLEESHGASDLFDAWDRTNQLSTIALLVTIMSSTLTLLSSHLPYHQYGLPIIRTLLSTRWTRQLSAYLGGSHNDLILATLKLFNAISAFGGGCERKAVFEAFPWDNKTLPKLLHMRRRSKGTDAGVSPSKPDIRTLYVLFILSFVDRDAPSVKTAFLEQRREFFVSIFKSLNQDPYLVVQRVLQASWDGLWSDQKVKRTLKIGVFGEATLSHLVKLYDRAVPEKEGGLHVPADIVHHFLLAICCRPGQGICFKDRGWYVREAEGSVPVDEEDTTERKRGSSAKIHNKILANFLPTLKINEDPRQQELALKIFAASPELVSGYWSAAALTFEPRLSSKWIANISFTGQVISQAVPTSSFLLPGTTEYNPMPPPLSMIIANILPSVGTKAYFTKGLQTGAAGLVQHCTALTLAKCLKKLAEVICTFKRIIAALEEEEEGGQWSQRRKEVEKESRRRVPEFQVIVAFSQQHLNSPNAQNTSKHTLLSEVSQRLLWLYQECLPDVVAEGRFEVGKLVLTLAEGWLMPLPEDGKNKREDQLQLFSPLQKVKQLHVLRLLNTSDRFTWSGKIASSSRTYFQVLLKTFCTTNVRALHTTLHVLLQQVLATSVLFQEDPGEVELWLASLPSGIVCRGPGTETPDGAPLTDEVDGVVTFLDECTQRCLKTPYRYMEAMADLFQSNDACSPDAVPVDAQVETVASPLLMTVLEQILAKINGRLMSPSDALSVFTFVRQLVFKLASKQEEAGYHALQVITGKLEARMASDDVFENHPSIRGAIRRELSIATACLRHLETGPRSNVRERKDADAVGVFLDRVEQVPVPENETARMTSAYELVDWVRLVDVPPAPMDISRLASVIRRFHNPTLKALLEVLSPLEGQLWESNILEVLEEAHVEVDFDWLFVHCSDMQFGDKQCRAKLFYVLFSRQVTSFDVERAMRLVLHGIVNSDGRTGTTKDLLLLLSELFSGAAASLENRDVLNLKATIAVSPAFLGLCLSVDIATEVHDALQKFIQATFNPTSLDDKKVLAPIAAQWAGSVKEMLSSEQHDKLRLAKPWIRFMESSELYAVLNLIDNSQQQGSVISGFLEELLSAVDQLQGSNDGLPVEVPVARLLDLQKQLPESPLLEGMIARSLASQLPVAYDGILPTSLPSEGLALLRLPRHDHLTSLPPDLISQFLERETWTDSTAQIVAVLLYAQASSSPIAVHWLNSKKYQRLSIDHLSIVFAAFLDCSVSDADQVTQLSNDVLFGLLEQLLSEWPGLGERRLRRLQCICYVLQQDAQRRPRLSTLLQKKVLSLPLESFAFEAMYIVRRVLAVPGCESMVASFVDRVLQWAVRHISNSGDRDDDARNALELLTNVSRSKLKLKAHLVEPLLTIIVKSHLHDLAALDLAVSLLRNTELKPVVVNRLLQNILQHENFFNFLGKDSTPSQRNGITRLLDGLFRLHPTNTCHPSHIEPLVQVYGGTMSTSDRRLLSIMRLFEAEKRTSISPFFSKWSPSPDASSANILEVVQNFDPVKMLRTCLFFPGWRRFADDAKGVKESPNDDHMYDPLLVIALSAQMLVESPPTAALAWVKLFRTNVVSLLIRCLSSKDVNIREAASCQLSMIFDGIQKSNMQEKSQALYVLQLLKNVMNPTADNVPRRLPTYSTLILLHALRGIFYPSNFIYPRTARFLLQRPELDVTDVPMLFNMLYSNSDDWKKERGWMIRMLADGMTSTEDWRVLKRRHTWDLLASLFQSTKKDRALRAGILEVLANLTCNAQACNSLILKSSLLSWIEIQLIYGHHGETMAWLRILENIAVIADTSKLERAMGMEWFAVICRSLSHIVQMSGDPDAGTLCQIAAVVLRLSLMEGTVKHHLEPVLRHAVAYLQTLESRTQLRAPVQPGTTSFSPPELVSPPHGAQGLHITPTVTDTFGAWGAVVETLWRVSMVLDDRVPEWDTLTSRLLIWRRSAGDDGSQLGEWVREESVRATRAYS
ncbi:ribosome 60S biogenesis N-terminal-domain-containing protein [Pisolithus croceorrhizus]|nr:ribosome 60S biogenesis N-terminal-domain-containing protein [Pisolithus croceorrhizus]